MTRSDHYSAAVPGPQRILVYGVTGAGKTTLARALARRLDLPLIERDELIWDPGWQEVETAEMRRRFGEIAGRDSWVIDGAGRRFQDLLLPRAELVVCLDYPRWVSLSRLLRRTALRVITCEVVCNGNRESLRQVLSRDSIVVWHWRTFRSNRDRMRAWAADPSGPRVVLLRSPRETRRWLGSLNLDDALAGQ